MQILNRESWLNIITENHIKPHFQAKGYTIPENVRLSCSFTSRGAFKKKGQKTTRIGECWSAKASADNHAEIFISPTISDSLRVLDILAHEMVHACHPGDGHGKLFKRTATAIGLEGKMTATVAGESFKQWATPVIDRIGVYPHADLIPANAIKKQTTRMLKCVCDQCGYTVRVAGKWLADMGAPHCPDHGEMQTV